MSPTIPPTASLSIDTPGSEFMTEKETAALLRCSLRHLSNLRARGDLPYFRLGERRVLYRRRDILQLLGASYVAGKGANDAA